MPRAVVILLLLAFAAAPVAAKRRQGPAAEAPERMVVEEEEAVFEEEEATFEEEDVSFDEEKAGEAPRPAAMTLIPEHEYLRWLLLFPVVCLLVLAWNVGWRTDDAPEAGRGYRRRVKGTAKKVVKKRKTVEVVSTPETENSS